jgi:hypothetical protein
MKALFALIIVCTFSLAASAETPDSMAAAAYLDDLDYIEETVAQGTMAARDTSEPAIDAVLDERPIEPVLDDHSAEALDAPATASDAEEPGASEQAAVPDATPAGDIAIEATIECDILFGHEDRFENLADSDAADTVVAAALQPGEEEQTADVAAVADPAFDE